LDQTDTLYLFGLLFGSQTDGQRIFYLLELLRDLSVRIGFTESDCLFRFWDSENLNIMTLAIEIICALAPDSFYLHIEAILRSLRPSRNLLTEIEEKLEIIPGLFALNCALASRNEELAIITVPNLIWLAEFWYFFPLLHFLQGPESERTLLAYFLTRNAVGADLKTIFYLMSIFCHNVSYRPFDILEILLRSFIHE
jgi:hypothetical protein